MKIATLGSCQTMALNWYVHQLLPDSECKWVSPEIFQFWGNKPQYTSTKSMWQSQVYNNIFDTNDGIDYLKSADYIICQKIKPTTSQSFNYEKIASYAKPSAKLVSLTYIYYDRSSNDPLQGMVEREELLLPDIKISNLISENTNRKHFKFNNKGTHCNSALFLEVLREICKKLEWIFFNDDKYKEIKEQYYPFGKNP
ncbi:hypothetical protein N9033_00910 [bacterium]|nr:hypothetical protein [bacterium]